MRILMTALFCLGVTCPATAQALIEDFDGGVFPPPGWTVVDNTLNGPWLTNTAYGRPNYTGGTGECAAIDSDMIGWGMIDTELITPSFVVPAGGALEFDHSFRWTAFAFDEQADVDISVNGGAWTLLNNFSGKSDGYPVGAHKVMDLTMYGGASAQIRFHYYNSNWDYWWQVDNVTVGAICGDAVPFGAGCPGSGGFTPSLSVSGCLAPGGSATLDLSQGLGQANAFMFLGIQQVSLPMGGGCDLLVSPPFLLFVVPLAGSGPGAGTFSLAAAIPLNVATPATAYLQAFVHDPGGGPGFSNSNGVKVTIP